MDAVPMDFYAPGPANVQCVVVAAGRQGVPANVLLALASNEGGKNGQLVRNKNGSYDISHFQINTATYARELKPYGVKFEDLRWRGCYNAEIAAWLLRKRLDEPGDDFWRKAANYHNRKPEFNIPYRNNLMARATEWANWLQSNYSVVNVSYR
jgi:Transglycosylase SLT domain